MEQFLWRCSEVRLGKKLGIIYNCSWHNSMRVIRDTQRSWLPISCFMSLFFPDTEPRIRISSRLIFNRISIYFVSFGDIVVEDHLLPILGVKWFERKPGNELGRSRIGEIEVKPVWFHAKMT